MITGFTQLISYPRLQAMSLQSVMCFILVLSLQNTALADDRAIKIIDEMEALYQGKSSSATMTMIVKTPQYERTMKMESSSM
ncbi:MAG: hypothetical protein ABGY96_29015, partial [bacterium]